MGSREKAVKKVGSERMTRARLLRTMFHKAGMGVAFVDVTDRRLLHANAEFCEIVGYSRKELKSMTLFDLTHAEDKGVDAASFEQLVRGEINKRVVEKRYIRKDRSLVWVRLRTTMVKVDATPVALTVVEDISERKLAEARLARSELRLRKSNDGKDIFLASLAHELRNPLAAIRNSVEVIKRLGIEDRNLRAVVPILERQSQQLSRLAGDLLDTSRITNGKVILDKRTVALMDVVERAVDGIMPVVQARSQSLIVDVPREALFVRGDVVRLTQVFANLLDNACKYTPEEGRVALVVRRRAHEVRVLIEDSGEGIAEDLLPHVFDLFEQGERPGQHGGGLGIGLTIVKRLVELHDGRISVASVVGKGSAFEIALPLDEASQDKASEPLPDAPAIQPMRILVVDDNKDAAASLSMCLQMSGHAVRTAAGGHEALKVARRFKPNVSLLDIDLPDMSGYELAKQLRHTAEAANMVLVAVTDHAVAGNGAESSSAGFTHHLLKPVTTAQLDSVFTSLSGLSLR